MKDPTPNDFRSIQSDVRSRAADRVIPKVAALGIEEPTAKRALDLMTAWDRNVTADSAGAAVFEVFLSRLDRAILGDELGDAMPLYLNLSYDSYLVYDVLFDRPGSALWDVRGTAARETPREVTEAALAETMAFLEQRLGKDPAKWAWGKLHVYDFAHPGATTAIEHRLLSRGPFPAPGDNNTVNVACFDPSKDGFTVQIVPSLRMIAPLSDLDKTTIVGALGQSGQPGREHYDDLIVPWLKNEPVPLHFAEESVRRATVQRLVLAP
jgi:penicillin amidase